jgi:hypothetical protein
VTDAPDYNGLAEQLVGRRIVDVNLDDVRDG